MNLFPRITGTVDSWDMIVMGHLRVNPYFGESYDAPPRGDPSTCTSVMVRGRGENGKPYVLIIDPTLRRTPEDYYFDINRRTGLHAGDVTHCFSTHHHGDHFEGLAYFPAARWMAAPAVADLIRDDRAKVDAGGIEAVTGEFLPGVFAVKLAGHTDSIHGVAFAHGGKKILVAADAVMSRHHFAAETTDFQKDPAMQKIATETIRSIKESFDVVIPGHDNVIVV